MADAGKLLRAIRFGPFELLFDPEELRKNGVRVKVSGQALQILGALASNPGRLVSREELHQKLWAAATYGDFEHGLNAAVNRLREILGDSATSPRYIETIPRQGYRFIATIEPDAKPTIVLPVDGPTGDLRPVRRAPRSRVWVAFALAGLVLVTLFYPWINAKIKEYMRLSELQRLTAVPLTSLSGNVISPTFSPDGSQVAFAWDGENDGAGFDLYVKTIGTDKPLRITHHPSFRVSEAWSPDGRSIAFSRVAGKEDSGIYLVAPTGGPERKIATRSRVTWYGTEVSWSPDGRTLAYTDHPANSPSDSSMEIYLLSLDTLRAKPANTGCQEAELPAFSPEGDRLAFACAVAMARPSLCVMRLSDGKITSLRDEPNGIVGISWSPDGQALVFSTNFDSGELWEIEVDRPEHPRRLPVGHDASDLAVSRAGNRLAYVQGRENDNIWRLDLSAAPPQARKLLSSAAIQRGPSISPDGKRIAFESNRTGFNEVWICDADGGNCLQLTSFRGTLTGTPRWSPDGRQIAFDSRVSGEAKIYLVDPNGGTARELQIDSHGNSQPSWSVDGKWIYFSVGDDRGEPAVWKAPSEGGHAIQVAATPSTFPQASPDGKYVYFFRGLRLWRVKVDGSSPEPVRGMPELNFLGDEWFPVSTGIYFIEHAGETTNIKFLDFQTNAVRQIFTLEKPLSKWIGGMPVSNDGKWLLYPQMDENSSNIMMIEGWR
jgi:Tol biopolymer transport system component/DNA-binding winged helix-turn-helix (wHTH) protein